ncbi:hypothetical protein EW146_g2062 [Bondarzewia mesenterica]|uniref:Uncharacterized protein n=1 Tax=Bondarzewia mesenterica TaxID=1095465 RepID=A0A4S4M1T4_9AGAM|nr:hypothetical protein EW146_g2062 [Bondarzewia mesenterica]
MPTAGRQSAGQAEEVDSEPQHTPQHGKKRKTEEAKGVGHGKESPEEPPKKTKRQDQTEENEDQDKEVKEQERKAERHNEDVKREEEEAKEQHIDAGNEDESQDWRRHLRQTGVIERGHIYFFYRPKVEHDEVHSIDDVSRFTILLIPKPPEFSTYNEEVDTCEKGEDKEDFEMALLAKGADAVPAKETRDTIKKYYRVITVGKKQLPDPKEGGGTAKAGKRRSGRRTYETKTKGTRHEASSRLAGRGAYALVNNDSRVPSGRATHLGYHLSHPSDMGEVQSALGIHTASSFVIQVKNPLAPPTGGRRVGLPESRRTHYPEWVMSDIFGKGEGRRRESFGLRFASVERVELLDYEGAELLLIASRTGEEGLENSLGEGRGQALHELEEKESKDTVDEVMRELAVDKDKFPAEPLEGQWF